MYAQQDKNRSGSPESSGLPLDSVLGAVPPEGLPGRQGPGNIQDTLVGTATETEADVLLLQKKGAVHQHIQLMKKFPVQRTHPAGGQLLVEVAGVAPDIPAGELLPHPAYQGGHLRLIPWPYWKSQVSGLKQPGQRWGQPDTKRETRTPGPLATSMGRMSA